MKKYKHYIIYRITNTINNKIYIGKHKCDILDDDYFGSGKRLWIAINKYGIDNFIFELLIDLHSEEEMDLLEEYVVNEEFLKRDDVYNMSRGGKNPCLYGKDNPFYGKTHSDKFKQKMSTRLKGHHISEQHKEKISEGFKKMLFEHPEIRCKFASLKNKKKCINHSTGEIRFFSIDDIPNDFEIYIRKREPHYISQERKDELREEIARRSRSSKWFNNGIQEIFCEPNKIPEGFVHGRLPKTNVGRKHSDETRHKMSIRAKGRKANNKGKIAITNGSETIYISKTEPIPNNWRPGMAPRRNKNEIT